jgi:hypothetical protein
MRIHTTYIITMMLSNNNNGDARRRFVLDGSVSLADEALILRALTNNLCVLEILVGG